MKFITRLYILLVLVVFTFRSSAQQVPVPNDPLNGSTNLSVKLFLRCDMILTSGLVYEFQYDTTASFNSPLLVDEVQNSWLIYPNTLRFRTTYYWRARTILNQTDTSLWSSTWNFSTLDSFQVSYPFNNNPSNAKVDVDLYFQPTGGMVRMQYDTSANFDSPVLVDTTFSDSLSWNASKIRMPRLYFGRTYYLHGMAYTSVDSLPFSKTYTFKTLAYPSTNAISGEVDVDVNPNLDAITDYSGDDTTIGYQLQLDTSLDYNSPLFAENIRALSYSNTSPFLLHYGKTYQLRIRAWHAKDTSIWSPPMAINTVDGPTYFFQPAFNDTMIRTDSVGIAVNSMANVIRYEVRADTSALSDSPALINDTLRVIAAYGVIRNLFFNKTYTLSVRAITAVDTSAWLTKTIRSMPYPFLLAPQNNNTFMLTNSELTWTALRNLTGYTVMLDTVADFSSPLVMVLDSNKGVSKVTTADLRFDQTYYWKLQARTAKDTSLWTPVFNFRTSPFAIYINSPYNGEQNVSINPTHISWNQPTGIRGYHYQVSKDSLYTSPINQYINDGSIGGDDLNGLEYNTRYFLRVRGFNFVDTTDWYYENIFTTIPEPPKPATPVLKTPANGAIKQPYAGLTLTWNAVSNATSYEVQTDFTNDFPTPATGTTGTNQITIATMAPSTQYYWRVRALNGTREGDWSTAFSFTTFELLNPPGNLVPDNFALVSPAQVTLQWEEHQSADRYEYQYANEPSFTGAATHAATTNQAVVNSLTAGLTYYWRVRTIVLPYASAWSDFATFRAGSTGIQNVISDNVPLFFPNPSTGYLTLNKQVNHVVIYTIDGKKMLELDQPAAKLDLTTFPKGIYMIELHANGTVTNEKLIKE